MSRTFSLALALACALPSTALALPYGPNLARGVTGDQMMVHWGTSSSVTPTVQYRLKGDTTFKSVTGTGSCNGNNCDWEAVITGLDADAVYEYQVPTDGVHSFQTCPAAGKPMDVVFYGDSRDGEQEHVKIVAAVMGQNPDMVFESGDIQADGTYAGYLANFFVTAKDLVATVPFMPAPGNHDANSNLKTNYGRVFSTPGNVMSSASWTSHYSFTCGNAMFISLDSNTVAQGDAQYTFLTGRLTAAQNDASIDHVFVWMHHPPYSPGEHGDTANVQGIWAPLFAGAPKVTAVFSGHDHIYAHLTDSSHVTYFVSGGAGAQPYTLANLTKTKGKVVQALGDNGEYNFVKVHIAGAAVTATAYHDNGLTVIDTWSNTTGGGGGSGGTGGTGGGGTGGTGGVGGGGTGGVGGGAGGSGGVSGGAGMGGAGGGGAGSGGSTGNGGATGGGGNGDNGNGGGSGGGCSFAGTGGAATPTLLVLALVGVVLFRRRRA